MFSSREEIRAPAAQLYAIVAFAGGDEKSAIETLAELTGGMKNGVRDTTINALNIPSIHAEEPCGMFL